jgi:hypothetical protein
MRLTFDKRSGATTARHGVYLTAVDGNPVAPICVYASANKKDIEAILGALSGGILTRITAAILRALLPPTSPTK